MNLAQAKSELALMKQERSKAQTKAARLACSVNISHAEQAVRKAEIAAGILPLESAEAVDAIVEGVLAERLIKPEYHKARLTKKPWKWREWLVCGLLVFLLGFATAALTGCATMSGIGEDVQNVSEGFRERNVK